MTYYRDVKPLLEQKCLACHVGGGIAPFALDDPDAVLAMAGFLAGSVEARTMPPWMPGPRSPPMRDDFSLTDEQIGVFRAFADAVAGSAPDAQPLGDPADAPPPVPPQSFPLTDPDVTGTMAAPYVPTGLDTGEDEFRCFVVDLDVVDTDGDGLRTMIGYRFRPGNALVDHHAILRLYRRADLDQIRAVDDASEGPGWSCFAGDFPETVTIRSVGSIGSWTPGNEGVVLFPGTGVPVGIDPASLQPGEERGVVAVFSMHYNVLNVIGDDGNVDLAAAADESAVELYFAPDDDDDSLLRSFNLPRNMNPDLRRSPIPADATAHVVATTVPLADMAPGARTLIERARLSEVFATGVFAHGHRLLSRVELVADEGTADELVLLDIPAWDYDWQGQYIYVDAHALDVEAPITVRCTYDNSPDNRARVGLDPQSVVVTAGEGTGDEMCIVALQVVGRDPT
ncbi:MAG: hypothetical protein FJ137_20205 [Deltaproteobacteria bacterium]|nr:hypothetical protein [Deltaproteobacteria bacterium]